MKRIHIPTLLMHGVLLVLIRLLSYHYPDGLLVSASVILLCHLVFSCISRRSLFLSHLLGCAMELIVYPTGLLYPTDAPVPLGTGLALLFYFIGLGISLLLEAVIATIRYYRNQPK